MPLLGTRGAASARGFGLLGVVKPPPPGAPGTAYQGGYYAGAISTAGNGIADYYLVVAPASSGQALGYMWQDDDIVVSGATSTIDGPANTTLLNDGTHPAAQFCEGLTINGYSDWYMPAYYELVVCYYNLKPSTLSNTTTTGTNPYSVPTRTTNYTNLPKDPDRVAEVAFQYPNSESFYAVSPSDYWSSTEASSSDALAIDVSRGTPYSRLKTYTNRWVRAVRRVPV